MPYAPTLGHPFPTLCSHLCLGCTSLAAGTAADTLACTSPPAPHKCGQGTFSAYKVHTLLMAAVGIAPAGWRAMHTARSQTATCLYPLLHTTINPQSAVSWDSPCTIPLHCPSRMTPHHHPPPTTPHHHHHTSPTIPQPPPAPTYPTRHTSP